MSDYSLRPMEAADKEEVIEMMRGFYASEAVHLNGSEEVFNNDVDACVSDNPYASGYVFTREDGSICGYSMLAHSYSAEYGRPVIWIEDLYIEDDARGKGLGAKLFDLVKDKYPTISTDLKWKRQTCVPSELIRRTALRLFSMQR